VTVFGPTAGVRIATAYGLGTQARLVGPVAHGRRGEVWQLTTATGRYAVKVSFQPPSIVAAERDAAFQDHVREAGIPMPAVVRTRDGSVSAQVDGRTVRVYEWVDVLAADRGLDPVAVGTLLARVHQLAEPAAGSVRDWFCRPVGEDTWSGIVESLRASDAPFADRVAALVPQFVALERSFERPDEVRLCHCDLWCDNLRATPDGELVLLDWENCGPESPSHELGLVVFEFGNGDPERMLALYAAYLRAGGPGRLSRPGDLTMVGSACEHLAEDGCRRWLAAGDPIEREATESLVGWLLDDPVTPATVRDILGAVAGMPAAV